jgi:tetratricopeptide (TPR) repeat protein
MAYQPEIEKLQRQYQDDPARFFAQLADVYRKRGRIDEALAMLREHLEARPNYVSGLIVLGRCLLDQHNDAEARETFERVIAVDREHIIALKALGEIGERTGDAGAARQWYQRLLEVDPMNDEAEAALGRLPVVVAAPAPVAPAPESAAALLSLDESVEAPAPRAPAPPLAAAASPSADQPPPPPPAPPEPEPVPEARTAEFVGDAPAVADDLLLERLSGEETPPSWPSAGMAEEEPPLEAAPSAAGSADDVSGWVEHPEELLNFKEGAGAATEGSEFKVEAFDESLGWGAGERVSRQISSDDLKAAEAAHEKLAAPVQNLPGLEAEPVPTEAEAATAPELEGLQKIDPDVQSEPLDGLEAGDEFLVPPAEPPAARAAMEPPAPAAPADAIPVPGGDAPAEDDNGRPSLAGLPVFFPEDEVKEPLKVEPEPEPVVTETMAELYVRQGLMNEARETYRQLLAARPHDRRLAARLAELKDATPSRDARTVYAASATGGQSSRSFLSDILGGRQSAAVQSPPEASDPAVEAPADPEPMDEAFNDEPEPRGEPTQPAKDDISLAAIFGEQQAVTTTPAPQPPPADARPVGGFSFDEFFSTTPPGPPDGAPPERAPRDTLSDDEGEEAFRDWLKGLKS